MLSASDEPLGALLNGRLKLLPERADGLPDGLGLRTPALKEGDDLLNGASGKVIARHWAYAFAEVAISPCVRIAYLLNNRFKCLSARLRQRFPPVPSRI